ncbi:MAG: sigma-54 dependent transcriptional regulator [Bacteroidota bacterium]|nr:sigma-54 dependent transcriptional regulator [Bacteroidota bacterium]
MVIEKELALDKFVEKPLKLVSKNVAPVFISQNPAIIEILFKIRLIANSQASVLITGESGTGKEVIASLIHHYGADTHRPFVAINSAALPKDVVDNELFGHEKEAFTGAVSKKEGCFELAHNGTLFLDEIVEMHPQTQAKLLRAIENKSIRRLGGKEEVKVDARIIAATNRDIPASLKSGELREDLFYRLSVIEIHIPSLRERKEDIPLLVNHFISLLTKKYGGVEKRFSAESLEMMKNFDWPGNVRELRNVVERVMLTCADVVITPRYLPERISGSTTNDNYIKIPIGTSMDIAEQMIIDQTLAFVNNNKSAAARILGLSRKTLHNNLNERSTGAC